MSMNTKYGGKPTDEGRRLVDSYLDRDDDHGKNVALAILAYEDMRIALERRSARRVAQGKSLVKYDPLSGQGRILALLCEEDGVSQVSIAKKLGVKPQTLSTAIKKLAAKGLVERKQNSDDKRAYLVFITEQGRLLKKKLDEIVPYSGSMFESLSVEELEQAIVIFNKLSEHLKNEIKAGEEVDDF